MARYRAVMSQVATCTVEFEAPEDATQEQLVEAAYEAETPTLCHHCSDRSNQSLNVEDDWDIFKAYDGSYAINRDDE